MPRRALRTLTAEEATGVPSARDTFSIDDLLDLVDGETLPTEQEIAATLVQEFSADEIRDVLAHLTGASRSTARRRSRPAARRSRPARRPSPGRVHVRTMR